MPDEALQTAFEIKLPAMRSAASCCAGTGRTSPGSTAWEPCWITSAPASRRAPNIMTVCPIWRAGTAGSSWIPPCVCGCCWTLKRMRPARWICWAIRSTLQLPAGPATRCALPAMKRPMPPTARRLRRRRSSSTRPWKHWKRLCGAPLRTSELGQYYRLAEDYLSRCGAKKPIASAAPEEKAPRAAKSGQSTAGRKKEGTSGSASRRSSAKQNTSGRSSGGRSQNRKQGGSRNSRARARQQQKQANRTVLLVLLAILAVGLLIRGFTMNWQ